MVTYRSSAGFAKYRHYTHLKIVSNILIVSTRDLQVWQVGSSRLFVILSNMQLICFFGGALRLSNVTAFVCCVLSTLLQMLRVCCTNFCIFMLGLDCSIRQYISKLGSFPFLWQKIGFTLTRMDPIGTTTRSPEDERRIFVWYS